MRLWRISNYADLSGRGGLFFSARWHTRGAPIVYAAEHPAGALLEFLVHMGEQELPSHFQMLTIEGTDDVSTSTTDALPEGWQTDIDATRAMGDRWLHGGSSALLNVPSAIVEDAHNILINPLHPHAAKLRITKVARATLDPRLTT